MKTSYKIITLTIILIVGFLVIPFYATNFYCDIFDSENGGCIRISGIGMIDYTSLPYFVIDSQNTDNPNECWYDDGDGNIKPCVIETGPILWDPFYPIDLSCDDECIDDDREYLKEVVYASNACSVHWRTNLFDMWENKTHDYKNDPIFQECSQWLEFENYANTVYDPNLKQLGDILERCIDSKDPIDTKGLSYSNDTHYIDTVNCEWQKLEMIKN